MRQLRSLALASALLLLSSCAAPSTPVGMTAQPDRVDFAPEAPSAARVPPSFVAGSEQAPRVERLIIRNAELSIVVTDTLVALTALSQLAEAMGGYVVSSSTYQAGQGALQADVQFRVEAKRFDEALQAVRALAVQVERETVSGQDVSAEYFDLEAQLRNLENTEAQLRKLQSEATTTQDVLAVYRELATIRGEIDRIKGRMQYLSQSAALASISVSLKPDVLAQPIQIAGWRPEGVAREAVQALVIALQALATLAIWTAIVIVPIAALIGLPVLIAIGAVRRWRKRQRAFASQVGPHA